VKASRHQSSRINFAKLRLAGVRAGTPAKTAQELAALVSGASAA
jgi:hypothetical protein